jgi:hypothetical protein
VLYAGRARLGTSLWSRVSLSILSAVYQYRLSGFQGSRRECQGSHRDCKGCQVPVETVRFVRVPVETVRFVRVPVETVRFVRVPVETVRAPMSIATLRVVGVPL